METKLKLLMLAVFLVYAGGFFLLYYYFTDPFLSLIWACFFPILSFKVFNKQSKEVRGRGFGELPPNASEVDREKYRKYKKYMIWIYVAICLGILGYINYQIF